MRLAAALLLVCCFCVAQVRLPDETAGLDNIAKVLISTFDQVDVLALADTHQRKIDSDLRLRVVRHPQFARKARFILVEFANTADQPLLDRYINGEDVSLDQLRQVWQNTCCGRTWDSPVYAEFLAAVRDLNKSLPRDQRIRVLGGDPPAGTPTTERDDSAVSVLRNEVLGKGKALVIYGGGHLGYGGAINRAVQAARPGGIFVVHALGGGDPDYPQFDGALKSTERPVLVSAGRPPFSKFRADFQTDAFVYFGRGPETEAYVRPVR